MAKVDFLTLHRRRLAKLPPNLRSILIDGSRVATVPDRCGRPHAGNVWGHAELVVPDLCLVIPAWGAHGTLQRAATCCAEMDIPYTSTYRAFMVRCTSPSGRKRWINEMKFGILSFANIGEQLTLKLMLPELC
jgi:hypothetical protein